VGLDQGGPRQHRLTAEAAGLALVRVAGRTPEFVVELARYPVRAAGAERNRAADRVEAADRLVAGVAVSRELGDGVGPGLSLIPRAQSDSISRR
jgi:hypothetical protein